MGKSARVLGWEFGRSARDMNTLLKDYGYLDGSPGAYRLTEKGERYGSDHSHENGYGGYAARSWETRTWNEGTSAALRADMESAPSGGSDAPNPVDETGYTADYSAPLASSDNEDDDPGPDWTDVAVAGVALAVIVGASVAAPHVKQAWNDKLKPAAYKLRSRFGTQQGAVD